MNSSDIWNRVKQLEGKVIRTYVEGDENLIEIVSDTEVIIKGRDTRPQRIDIEAAYKLLEVQHSLKRTPDLDWLANPDKQTSSIVFAIVGNVAGARYDPKTKTLKL